MVKQKEESSLLNSEAVDSLLVLCEEVMRATPEGTKRFIEPAPGVLARAKSKQHNIIFGRRGSGKSSLLRKMAADLTVDRRPIAFVDMETFKGHSYPDVLISVLIKSLQEFSGWLETAATAPASKTTFWTRLFGTKPARAAFSKQETDKLNQSLKKIIADLETQLHAPDEAEHQVRKTLSGEQLGEAEGRAGAAVSGLSAQTAFQVSEKTSNTTEHSSRYISRKIEYLHQNILEFQKFFRALEQLSGGPNFLILDDLYHIRRADQAKVIDYFHRIAKGNGLWLKIGTIKHRSEWYQHSDPPVGMKLGDDATEINLDISLERFGTLRTFLQKILTNLMAETPPVTIRDLLNRTAIDRLIIASGGVVRDFIGIFSKSITEARNRGEEHHRGPKIGAEDINLATGAYGPIKQEEFKLDTDTDREELEAAFEKIVEFCTRRSKCNVFLVSQKLSGPTRTAIDQLIDLRMIHPVKSRVTLKRGAVGELFEAYMLDLSQYTAARKVRDFEIIDLSASDKDESIRRSSLVYADGE